MRIRTIGLAALMAGSLMGNGMAQSVDEEIQNDEEPGSEIGVEIGPGSVQIERERNLNPSPVEIQGQTLDVPDDPDAPGKTRSSPAECLSAMSPCRSWRRRRVAYLHRPPS